MIKINTRINLSVDHDCEDMIKSDELFDICPSFFFSVKASLHDSRNNFLLYVKIKTNPSCSTDDGFFSHF
jgi:hypothetical protein